MSRVSIIGSPYWTDYIARSGLDAAFWVTPFPRFRSLLRAPWRLALSDDVIVLGHGVPDRMARFVWFFLFVLLWALGPRRPHLFLYWIGTEILRPAAPWQWRLYRWFAARRRVHVICGAPWFKDMLAERGLTAAPVLFPYDTAAAAALADTWPTDEKLIASTYLTPSHWENSRGDWIVALCEAWPDVRWKIIGLSPDTAPDALRRLENVELCGWVSDPQAVVSACHAFLRLTRHDAYAGTVRDAQVMQRIVIFTKPIGDCIQVSSGDPKEVKAVFSGIVADFALGDPERIAHLRSSGAKVPSLEEGTKALSKFMRKRHA